MLTKTIHHDIGIITSSRPLLGRVYFAAKTYVFGSVLIDGGIYSGSDFFGMAKAPTALCITHPHPDHMGYASPLHKRLGIPVYVSEDGLTTLASPMKPQYPIRLAVPRPDPCAHGSPCPPVIEGGPSPLIRLDMPGHTRDHICFFDEDGSRAFTGDLLLWGSSPWVGPEVDMHRAIESLEALSDLDLEYAYPGHGAPMHRPTSLIGEKLERMRAFGKKIGAMRKKGMSEREIQVALLGHEGWMYFFSRGYFSKRNLVRSYLDASD